MVPLSFPLYSNTAVLSLKSINLLLIVLPLIIALMVVFVRTEQKYFKKNPSYLFKSEYEAMTWIKNNTNFDSTLVYVSPKIRDKTWWGAYWTTSTSERRSFNNRINEAKKLSQIDKMPIDSKELEMMYYNIDIPFAKQILKKYKITHILIPSLPTFRSKKGEIEEIHSIYDQSPYVKQVFKAEDRPITATVYEVR